MAERERCEVTVGHSKPMAVREPIAVVAAVEPGSIAAQLGLAAGDRIRRVSGQPPRDVIDWALWTAASDLDLLVEQANGEERLLVFSKDVHEDLGVVFDQELFTPLKTCNNACPFCFVLQAPPGLRPTIYVKDDDYRLSFLHGNFVTLTNLTEQHLERIVGQQLSPLYVSVHAADPVVRRLVLGNDKADVGWSYLQRLLAAGIECHTQIVCCPGVNDGAALRKTIASLRTLGDGVLSVGVVPVGLTRYQSNELMQPMTPDQARAALEVIVGCQGIPSPTPVYAADELYLRSGEPLPPADQYDDFCQLDNGIGLVRLFLDDTEDLAEDLPAASTPKRVTLVTGEYGQHFVPQLVAVLDGVDGLSAEMAMVRNDLFGGNVACAGLLAGRDIIAQVGPKPGRVVLVPARALDDQQRFIDNLTLADLATALRAEVLPAGSPREAVAALGIELPAPPEVIFEAG